MKTRYATLAACVGLVLAAGCDFKSSLSSQLSLQKPQTSASGSPDPAATASASIVPDVVRYYIRGKRTSNISQDGKTITLSLDAVDPGSGILSITWEQEQPFGAFNSNRGADVQWTATRGGTYTVVLVATVQSSARPGEPDVARFYIPVQDGQIKPAELAPEVIVTPQSLVLFRPLPLSLARSPDDLAAVGVKTSAQLSATTYVYDPASNTKVKKSGDFNEIKWFSGDPSIVTVDDNGLVRPADGSDVGRAVVTATSKTNSASSAGSQVTVQYLDTAIDLSYPTTSIYRQGQGSPNSVTIGATVEYSNPTDRNRVVFTDPNGREITWRSSNPAIAQVSASGVVTPLADAATGDVVISAISRYDPSKNAKVTIRVLGN